jgi:hypothetical protein
MKYARKVVTAALCLLFLACGDSSDDGWGRWGTKNKWSEDEKHVDVQVAPPSYFDIPRTIRCICGGRASDGLCAMIIGDDFGVGPQYLGLESATVNGRIVIAFAKCDPRFTNYGVLLPLDEL